MTEYAGAGGSTQVHANVETSRLVYFAQHGLRPLGEIHELISDLLWGGIELANMLVGDDEEMATDVRIEIENYEVVLAAVEDEVFFVVFLISGNVTKDATA